MPKSYQQQQFAPRKRACFNVPMLLQQVVVTLLQATLALLVVPLFAFADTTADLQTLTQTLQASFQSLQKSMHPAQFSYINSPDDCSYGTRTLRPGSSGVNVQKLQLTLLILNYIKDSQNVTGYYGPITRNAVEQFQRKHNIVSAGMPATTGFGAVGAITRAAVINDCRNSFSATTPAYVPIIMASTTVSNTTSVSGIAPFFVTVVASPPVSYEYAYGIDFGDGKSTSIHSVMCAAPIYGQSTMTSMTCDFNASYARGFHWYRYDTPGRYTVRLFQMPQGINEFSTENIARYGTILGTAMVTVAANK